MRFGLWTPMPRSLKLPTVAVRPCFFPYYGTSNKGLDHTKPIQVACFIGKSEMTESLPQFLSFWWDNVENQGFALKKTSSQNRPIRPLEISERGVVPGGVAGKYHFAMTNTNVVQVCRWSVILNYMIQEVINPIDELGGIVSHIEQGWNSQPQ